MNRRPQWCIGFARTQAGEEVSRGGVILCSAWEVGRVGGGGFLLEVPGGHPGVACGIPESCQLAYP